MAAKLMVAQQWLPAEQTDRAAALRAAERKPLAF